MEKQKKISVCTYDFMYGLGLRGAKLSVYAFLYSYRKSEMGFFFGKRQFIADRCFISLRSVERALKELLERGLIEYCASGKHRGICVSEDFIPKSILESEGRAEQSWDISEYGEASFRTDIVPKYKMVSMGRGYFTLTVEQVEALLALVPVQELESYVAKIDRMLENNMASGIKAPKSYYKTIKKWILEDCAL